MNVYITHFNFQYMYQRSILNASLYSEEDDTLLKSGRLADLLQEIKNKRYTLSNAQDVLHEVVNVRGFSA